LVIVTQRRFARLLHDVFRSHGQPLAHLPAEQHGLLGSLKENYGKIRARVAKRG
jgi:hypothetical protein